MSEANRSNRVVWLDIPVVDLKRAIDFYHKLLDIPIEIQSEDGVEFGVLEHCAGVGGCLVTAPKMISDKGCLAYLNAEGRIRQAERLVEPCGGRVLQSTHNIGPNGYKCLILDSEGNRIALHSMSG